MMRAMTACLIGCLACADDGSAKDGGRSADARAQIVQCEAGQTRTFYRDRDGDGLGIAGPGFMHGCHGDVFEGLADNARDCDDTDPKKHRSLFVDADGDGFGSTESVCATIDAGGFSLRSDDCDDSDADRSPADAEAWFDGRDSDCDGQDDPAGCIAAPGAGRERYATGAITELPPLDSIPVDTTPECESAADLYFAVLGGCPVCGGGLATIVIANAGTIATAFRVTSNEESIDVTEALAPRQVAAPLSLTLQSPESAITVSPLGDTRDCRAANDSKTVRVGFTDCTAP